jgi:hypothetical protein
MVRMRIGQARCRSRRPRHPGAMGSKSPLQAMKEMKD